MGYWSIGDLTATSKETTHFQGVIELVTTKSLLPFSVSVGGRSVWSLIDVPRLAVDWEGPSWAANPDNCPSRLRLANGATYALSSGFSGDGWSRK